MSFFKYALIISAASFFVFSCSNTASNTATQNVNPTMNNSSGDSELAAARKIYQEKCVACHKENGEGGKIELENDSFSVPSYKTDRAKNKSDEKLLDYIEKGDDDMPPFQGKLTTEEMKALVKMIRKDFQEK